MTSYTPHQILFGLSTQEACGTYGGQRRYTQDLLGRCDGKIHLEDLGLDGSMILICISKKLDGRHGLDCSSS